MTEFSSIYTEHAIQVDPRVRTFVALVGELENRSRSNMQLTRRILDTLEVSDGELAYPFYSLTQNGESAGLNLLCERADLEVHQKPVLFAGKLGGGRHFLLARRAINFSPSNILYLNISHRQEVTPWELGDMIKTLFDLQDYRLPNFDLNHMEENNLSRFFRRTT